jgi:hypothetical protein
MNAERGQGAEGIPLLGVLRDTDDVVRIPLDDEVEPIISVYPALPDAAALIILLPPQKNLWVNFSSGRAPSA